MDVNEWTDGSWPEASDAAEDLEPRFAIAFLAEPFTPAPPDLGPPVPGFGRPSETAPALGPAYRADVEEVVGKESELLSYLSAATKLAGPDAGRLSWRYSLVFALRSTSADIDIDFPYWDSFYDIDPFLLWLRGESSWGRFAERNFSDLDQGWIFSAARRGARLHFRSGVLEDMSEDANASVSASGFLARLDHAETTARSVLNALEEALAVSREIRAT